MSKYFGNCRYHIEETVFKLVPYTAHTHVTDAKKTDKGFELVLMGQGDLDCLAYVKAMHQAGWTDFITLEVSVSSPTAKRLMESLGQRGL